MFFYITCVLLQFLPALLNRYYDRRSVYENILTMYCCALLLMHCADVS